jgi:hypothetical protein
MNTRSVIGVSVMLNLALAAGVFLLLKGPAERGTARRTTAAHPAAVINTESRSPKTSPPGRHFYWSELVSEDLKVYRDNLLAFGCSGPTLRNIILGEINERFGQRRRDLLAAMQGRFWDYAIRGEAVIRNEWGQPIEALAAERQKMIDDVLGMNYGTTEAELQTDREVMQQQFAWLSAEKRDRLFALEQRREQRLEEWAKSVGRRPDGLLTAEDNARLQAVQQEFEDARKALLTPKELEESSLRSSKNSLWASSLSGFEATEDEWRAVTRLQNDFDEARRNLANPDLSDAERQQGQGGLQDALAQATQAALGPERFAQYEVANNEQFQEVYKVTQRYGLPENVAVQAYEVQQTAMTQAEEVRGDPNLSPEARQAALTAIQQETGQTMANTLGEKVFSTYQEYGGAWLNELNQGGNE